MNSPSLIKENDSAIEARYLYLTKVMRLEVPEIVKSEVFSKSIEELKTRHMFLDRLGLFKPRSIRADPDEPTKNHRLYQIVDSSDKSFATKIARVTLFEWEVFQDLYSKELKEADDEELYEESDEEWFCWFLINFSSVTVIFFFGNDSEVGLKLTDFGKNGRSGGCLFQWC